MGHRLAGGAADERWEHARGECCGAEEQRVPHHARRTEREGHADLEHVGREASGARPGTRGLRSCRRWGRRRGFGRAAEAREQLLGLLGTEDMIALEAVARDLVTEAGHHWVGPRYLIPGAISSPGFGGAVTPPG